MRWSMLPDSNLLRLEFSCPVSKEVKRKAEEMREAARDTRARVHQTFDRTWQLAQKTEEIIQHDRAWRDLEDLGDFVVGMFLQIEQR